MTWRTARRFGPWFMALGLLFETMGRADAGFILDQQNVVTSSNSNGAYFLGQLGIPTTGHAELAQTFTVGLTGMLARVDVQVNRSSDLVVTPLVIDIVRTTDGIPEPGSVLASLSIPAQAFPVAPGGFITDMTGADLGGSAFAVTQGEVLGLLASVPAPDTLTGQLYYWQVNTSYSGGALFRREVESGGPFISQAPNSGGFRTYVAVPEPSSLAMCGPALVLGLGYAWWRRVRRTTA